VHVAGLVQSSPDVHVFVEVLHVKPSGQSLFVVHWIVHDGALDASKHAATNANGAINRCRIRTSTRTKRSRRLA
jgi:hypothetical protein